MDRYGRRPPLIVAFALAAIGMFTLGLAVLSGSFAIALLGLSVIGVGLGSGQLARLAAADLYSLHDRGKALSYVLVGGAAGAICGPLATSGVAALARARGWDPTAAPLLAAPLALVLGIPLIVFIRPDPRDAAQQLMHVDPALQSGDWAGGQALVVRPLRQVAAQFPARAAIVSITGLEAVMVMIMTIVPIAVIDRGYTIPAVSILVSIHFLGMFGLSIPIGWLADRLGRKPVLATGCAVSATGCLLLASSDRLWLIAISFFLVGLGWSLGYIAATTILADVTHPHERGSLIGVMDFSVAIGAAIASLLSGLIYGAAGLVALGLVGAIVAAFPLGFSLRLRERAPGCFDL